MRGRRSRSPGSVVVGLEGRGAQEHLQQFVGVVGPEVMDEGLGQGNQVTEAAVPGPVAVAQDLGELGGDGRQAQRRRGRGRRRGTGRRS